MDDINTPRNLEAEIICSNVVRLLRKGYEVRIKSVRRLDRDMVSVSAAHPDRDTYVRQLGGFDGLSTVTSVVFDLVERGEANDDK